MTTTQLRSQPPKKNGAGFMVDLTGAVRCDTCGKRGVVPHHLSLKFWQFLTRDRLLALAQSMAPGKRVVWFGHRVVKCAAPDGSERVLRESNGEWFVEVSEEKE